MQKMHFKLAQSLAIVVAMLVVCAPAHAHPHVWVTVEIHAAHRTRSVHRA